MIQDPDNLDIEDELGIWVWLSPLMATIALFVAPPLALWYFTTFVFHYWG